MSTLFDMNYFSQNRDAMLYVKLSAGEPAFYSSFEPVPHGKDAFEMLFKSLNDAKDEIFLATWYLEPNMELLRKNWDGSISSRANYVLENLLISKAKQGVIIRGLVWNFLNLGVTEAPFDWMTPGTVTVPIEVAGKIMMRKVHELNNRLRKINRVNEIVVTNHTMPFATTAALGISFPLGGSHHQKMWVTRSGTNLTAFVGGMNLRQHDWDSQSHAILDQRRNPASMEGKERKRKETALEDPDYPPRHDWMVRMEGQAAYRVLEEFKKRWAMARRKQFPTLTLDKIPTAGKLFVQKSRTYPIQFGGGGAWNLGSI